MKKCILCMVLLCFALAACATVTNQPATTTAPQTNATTLPSSSTTTTFPPTRPTTRPTPYKDPICYIRHTFENGICKYCKAKDPNHTGTYPTENFCAQGHTYAGPYCVYCLAVNPDYAKCESTHTYQNGYCIYCRAVDATFDFCAQGHTFKNGFCAYCGIADEDYHPCQGGHTFQNGYCIYCLDQQPSAGQPTTVSTYNSAPTKPTTCGLPQCYGKGHTYEKGYCIYCLVMDPNYDPCAGGHTFENGFCIYCATADPAMQKPTTQPGTSYISDRIVPHGEAFENRPIPGSYVMKEVDGQFYIDFGKDNKRVILDAGCIRYPRDITFASAEEMYRDLMTGDLTIEELQIIRAVFPLVEGVGFQLPNPKDVYGIPVPDGMELIITVSGSGFVVTARTPVGTPHEQMMHVQHTVLTEEEFKEKMEHFNRFEQGTVDYTSKTLIPERNAVEYRLSRSDGFVDCHVQYVYEADGKTIYVEERYPAEVEEPSFITVYGVANGEYYKMYMPYVSGTPTAQWLMQFQKIPYTAE